MLYEASSGMFEFVYSN